MRYKKIFVSIYFVSQYGFIFISEASNKKPSTPIIERVEKHDKEPLFTELQKIGKEQELAIEECCFGLTLNAGGATIVKFVLPPFFPHSAAYIHCVIPACSMITVGTVTCCKGATQLCYLKMRMNAIAEELKRK